MIPYYHPAEPYWVAVWIDQRFTEPTVAVYDRSCMTGWDWISYVVYPQ